LQGGEEKVEEVRLSLLGFKRDVEELRETVDGKRREFERLLGEKMRVRGEIQLGKALLDVDARVRELEERLMVASIEPGKEDEHVTFSESDDESEDEIEHGVSIARLERHAHQLICIQRLVQKIGPEHPFLVRQEERILRLRQTILLDLGNTLKQCSATTDEQKGRTMKLLGIYRDMGESQEALKVLKEQKLGS
jgi:hypothetical protein